MKKAVISIIGLIAIICFAFSTVSVNALNSDEWRWSSSGMKQSYFQGDSGSVTLTFYSSCPDQLRINQVSIKFDWNTVPEGYTLETPVGIATNGQNTFSTIYFKIPAGASIGSHSFTVLFKGQQQGLFGYYDISATGTGTVYIKDAYEKIYEETINSVQNSLANAQNSYYRSPEAQSLLQQAINMFNQATSLANQGQWQAAVNDLNTASNYLSQAAAKEAMYTPPPTPTPNSDIYGDANPTTPEFPSMAILAGFLVLSLVAATLLTVRKRKLNKN